MASNWSVWNSAWSPKPCRSTASALSWNAGDWDAEPRRLPNTILIPPSAEMLSGGTDSSAVVAISRDSGPMAVEDLAAEALLMSVAAVIL